MFVKRFLLVSRRYLFAPALPSSERDPLVLAIAPTEGVVAGNTALRLSGRFIHLLDALQLLFSRVRPGRLKNGIAAFPISGGSIDLANGKGEMLHLGGMTIGAGPVALQMRDFAIDTTGDNPLLTGMVIVNDDLVGRMPLLHLEFPPLVLPLHPQRRLVRIANVRTMLTGQAAQALNRVFGVDQFARGMYFGMARVKALVTPAMA